MASGQTQVKGSSEAAHKGEHGRGGDRGRGDQSRSQPILKQYGDEIQDFDSMIRMPLGLTEDVCRTSVVALNQILADSLAIRDLYKKCHWQVSGPTFYSLHLLFDKHYNEQAEICDLLGERVQIMGGISIAMGHDVAEVSDIPRPPRGREEAPAQIGRLLEAHEIILKAARRSARQAAEGGDDGTNDILVSDVIRTNETQIWFLAEHLVNSPLVRSE
jgi:starvation-inducible DNA-binding protein